MNAAVTGGPTITELENERAFLLASLADLERERDAGAIDDATYQTLADDYTARAAGVIRELEAAHGASSPPNVSRRWQWKAIAVWAVVGVFVAASAGVLWRGLSDRSGGESLTGRSLGAQSAADQQSLLEADIARNPNNAAAHRALARFFLQEQQYAQALREFDRAAALDPQDAESRAYGGWVLSLAGLSDRALPRLDEAIAVDPEYADAYFFRGMVYFRGFGQPEQAIPDFERFLAIAPNAPMAEQVRGVLSAARQTSGVAPTTVPSTATTK